MHNYKSDSLIALKEVLGEFELEGRRGLRWFHAADDNCVSSLVKVTPCTRSETGRWQGQIFLHSDHLFLSPLLFKVLTPPAALMRHTSLTSRAKKKKRATQRCTTPSASTARGWTQRRAPTPPSDVKTSALPARRDLLAHRKEAPKATSRQRCTVGEGSKVKLLGCPDPQQKVSSCQTLISGGSLLTLHLLPSVPALSPF